MISSTSSGFFFDISLSIVTGLPEEICARLLSGKVRNTLLPKCPDYPVQTPRWHAAVSSNKFKQNNTPQIVYCQVLCAGMREVRTSIIESEYLFLSTWVRIEIA